MFTKPKIKVKNTMSREEYEKTLKSLQDQIEELKKVEVVDDNHKKSEIWIPNPYESYYYLDEYGVVGTDFHDTLYNEDCKIVFGNFYKTEVEARHQYFVQKYTNLFRKYVEEHSEPLDWEDNSQEKLCIYWSYKHKCIGFCSDFYGKYQGIICASSMDILEDAIEFVGRDNVIKYVLRVKNA